MVIKYTFDTTFPKDTGILWETTLKKKELP